MAKIGGVPATYTTEVRLKGRRANAVSTGGAKRRTPPFETQALFTGARGTSANYSERNVATARARRAHSYPPACFMRFIELAAIEAAVLVQHTEVTIDRKPHDNTTPGYWLNADGNAQGHHRQYGDPRRRTWI